MRDDTKTPPESVQEMWRRYLDELGNPPEAKHWRYQWWPFSDNQRDADELVEVVLRGVKRATAPSLWYFELSGEPVPKPGDHDVVVDWSGTARCVIRTTHVDVVPYEQVSEEFAAVEGEGDGSLRYWREVHWPYYHRELEPWGREPTPDLPIVCQRFEVVFPRQEREGSIRPARADECGHLTNLALRSKAYWGYDEAFMAACRDELTLTPTYLENNPTFVVEDSGRAVGLVTLEAMDGEDDVELGMLFVEPAAMGGGFGSRLFEHAWREAGRRGYQAMWIQSDPDAEGFYSSRGAVTVGRKESKSLPGRFLPWMRFDLGSREANVRQDGVSRIADNQEVRI